MNSIDLDSVNPFSVAAEKCIALIVRKIAGDFAISCPEPGIAAHHPVHREIAAEHAALWTECFNGLQNEGSDGINGPVAVEHAEPGNLDAQILKFGQCMHA